MLAYRPLQPPSRLLTKEHGSGPLSAQWGGTYLALLRVGFAKPTCRHAAGALLPHLFTLAHGAGRLRSHVTEQPVMLRGRYLFCGTVRKVTLPGRYPAPCPAESGLSSRPPQ